MKLTKMKRGHSLAFNLTPMIDIVFLLIIFFMTVSQITRVVDHPMSLPVVHAGASVSAPNSVTLNINAAGQIIVSGKRFSMHRVTRILEQKIQQLGGKPDSLRIEIRCDRRCPSQHINRIIEQLADLKIQAVRIAVTGDG